MNVTTVVGNPKARSRTFAAARLVAERLTGRPPDTEVDLVDLGAGLLDADVGAALRDAVASVRESDLLVVASPTYKGTFTGLLKLFLDRFDAGSLAGVSAIPVMLGGDLRHSLAPEVFLKPVLAELGASTPTRGLFLLEKDAEAGHLGPWEDLTLRQLRLTVLGRAST